MEEESRINEAANSADEKNQKEEIFTRVVRAGKRTYFFDVKATRKDDYYLTITESKKRLGKEVKVFYEKHKIFLYREDFEKFSEGLKETVDYIGNGHTETDDTVISPENKTAEIFAAPSAGEFTDVEFDDLGKK